LLHLGLKRFSSDIPPSTDELNLTSFLFNPPPPPHTKFISKYITSIHPWADDIKFYFFIYTTHILM
jgi:hypothetical protein